MSQHALHSSEPQSQTTAASRKIFICYASENVDLLKDFVKKLKEHYGDIELFFDGIAYSGNLHTRFRRFAEQCDIAILLVNARFANFESYANKYEIPILMDRQKKHEVTIVGVLFSDVDVEAWNKTGDIYFFQLKNGDLTRTRRKDENSDHFHTQCAVYETIAKEDRNTYHKELVKWINQAIESTAIERADYIKSNPDSGKSNAEELTGEKAKKIKQRLSRENRPPPEEEEYLPRSIDQSKRIIDKIYDPFLRALETQLSMSNDYWHGFDLTPGQKNDPLLPVFFERQRNRIIAARARIAALDETADGLLGVRLKSILPEVEKVQQDMSDLLRVIEVKDDAMDRLLTRFESKLGNIRSSLRLAHIEEVKAKIRDEQLPDMYESLDFLTEKMNELDNKINGYMSN